MKKRVFAALISLISMNVVCLSLLTFAWFTANQKVDNGMSNLSAVMVSDSITYDVFRYEYGTNVVDVEGGEGTKVAQGNGSSITLNSYDSVFAYRNKYSSLIMRLNVSLTETEFEGTKNLEIVLSHNTDLDNSEGLRLSSYISSVIAIKGAKTNSIPDEESTVPTDGGYKSSSDYIYKSAVDYFSEVSNAQYFVDKDDDDYAKTESISVSFSYTQSELVDGVLRCYISWDYDADLVEEYMKDRDLFGSAVQNVMDIGSDITSIDLKVAGA